MRVLVASVPDGFVAYGSMGTWVYGYMRGGHIRLLGSKAEKISGSTVLTYIIVTVTLVSCEMSKNIYYSDKYFDEIFEYR